MFNQKIAKELHKPIIRIFEKGKVYSFFKDNIQGEDLADKQVIGTYKEGIRLLLCVVGVLNKYEWLFRLKDKKRITITNPF